MNDELFSLLVYNSVVLSSFLLIIDKIKHLKKLSPIILLGVLSFVIIISSIRYSVGRDFIPYEYIFLYPEEYERLEFGFLSTISFIKLFSENPQWLFLVSSCLIYIPIYLLYTRGYNSIVFIASWFLLFYLPSLNQLRQFIAMSIILFSVQYMEKSKSKYFILSICASLFHITGLISFIYPLLSRIKIKSLYLLIFITPLLMLINLPNLLTSLSIFNESYYAFYVQDSNIYAGQQTLSIGGITRLFLPIIFIIYYRNSKDRIITLIKNALFIYTALYFLSINFYILYRIYSLFQIFIPMACFYLFRERNNLLKVGVILYMIILFVLFQKAITEQTIFPTNGNAIFPYQTIFDKNPQVLELKH